MVVTQIPGRGQGTEPGPCQQKKWIQIRERQFLFWTPIFVTGRKWNYGLLMTFSGSLWNGSGRWGKQPFFNGPDTGGCHFIGKRLPCLWEGPSSFLACRGYFHSLLKKTLPSLFMFPGWDSIPITSLMSQSLQLDFLVRMLLLLLSNWPFKTLTFSHNFPYLYWFPEVPSPSTDFSYTIPPCSVYSSALEREATHSSGTSANICHVDSVTSQKTIIFKMISICPFAETALSSSWCRQQTTNTQTYNNSAELTHLNSLHVHNIICIITIQQCI